MRADKRVAARKTVDCINIADLTTVNDFELIATSGYIVDASSTGFLVLISRKDIVCETLRDKLSLDNLNGQNVVLYLPQMNLDLDGLVIRTNHTGRGFFEIAIQFSDDVPPYWRDCLIELLPEPGEIEEEY